VKQHTKQEHRGSDGVLIGSPGLSDRPVQFNLEPEVAAAMLQHLIDIAEPTPSRSGKTKTLRMKKAPAATGAQSRS
jgi:hypothetical protein